MGKTPENFIINEVEYTLDEWKTFAALRFVKVIHRGGAVIDDKASANRIARTFASSGSLPGMRGWSWWSCITFLSGKKALAALNKISKERPWLIQDVLGISELYAYNLLFSAAAACREEKLCNGENIDRLITQINLWHELNITELNKQKESL